MSRYSWGLYPEIQAKILNPFDKSKLKDYLLSYQSLIPYGNGRSYGDSALSDNIITSKYFKYFLEFDENNGILKCQSGVLLSDILNFIVPRGWFLEITPGTKLITIGGAIASDVHGKNHHKNGCFSNSIINFNLMLPSGDIVNVKPNDELFKATCGGMGLTGFIIDATIKLKRINSQFIKQRIVISKNLKEAFDAFEKYSNAPYSVAWIDCLADKNNLGRSILFVGDFENDSNLNYNDFSKKINVPFYFPPWTLNKYSVKSFNYIYYFINNMISDISKVHFDKFFYPLDAINNWNRIYGKNGFTQYQFILPKNNSYDGLMEILYEIYKSGLGSFLSVLKLYGKQNQNYLSFPIEGYSLALDFKIEGQLFDLLDKLDQIVVKYSGRVYLTKDVRMKKEIFYSSYDKIDNFLEIKKMIDPKNKLQSLQSRRIGL
ncbi:MAG TPA: FAD-binding oxidoreductase [Ignavibacteriales bacterium]|nr:FAD-binding oxidoreductase [Ignavibacteriales bacterium]HOL81849.1 FAD-binding oxidoreductase [Ignavibacteriales bacterium]HOM65050.1 FAD-binding oxidoreductase [Ignavibacteriales bacterium]HPP34014.1 FAD-binding oxidoreductase [Ignavibacteriales bacterium]HRR17729.1 FAD-binding oxidoreductase [Ignavibacteriales bacterium]